MEIDKKFINSETIATIAAISEDDGVVLFEYYKRSVDRFDFEKYLRKLRTKLGDQKVCLYMD